MSTKGEDADGPALFRKEALAEVGNRYGAPVHRAEVHNWALTLFLLITFCVAVGFLFVAHYDRKETVSGVILPSTGALSIVSPQPGIVAQVLAKEGDEVRAGAPLIRMGLDPVIADGQRLGRALQDATQDQTAALMEESQAQDLALHRQREELAAQRSRLVTLRARLRRDLDLQKRRVQLSADSVAAARPLKEQGFFSELQFRQREDYLVQAQQEQSAIESKIEDTDASLIELPAQEGRLIAVSAQSRARLRNDQAAVEERRITAAAAQEIVLTAPAAGRLATVRAKPGMSVPATSSLAVVLPRGAVLEAQLFAPSRSVGFVKPGDPVRLMFDAFPYQRFGVGRGKVASVATTPTAPEDLPIASPTAEPMYQITVTLDAQTVDAYGQSWNLMPGGRVTADLVLERRSFVEWLFAPVFAIAKRNSP